MEFAFLQLYQVIGHGFGVDYDRLIRSEDLPVFSKPKMGEIGQDDGTPWIWCVNDKLTKISSASRGGVLGGTDFAIADQFLASLYSADCVEAIAWSSSGITSVRIHAGCVVSSDGRI